MLPGFDSVPVIVPVPPDASPQRRRTLKQRRALELGIHPATGAKLLEGESTCGDCVHCTKPGGFWKCDLIEITSGPATDIRRRWPACRLFEAVVR